MNIWIGTDLAADILGSVKDTPGDKVAQVIVKNANEPYYKGICSDAKRCGVEIITAEKLVHNCTHPTISLNPYIRVPDAINLDGGYLTPCTAEASMRLLRRYGFIFQGADVLLLGRSERVGEPLSHLLTRANATVTIAHSLTKSSSIWRLAQNADLIISSVGRADFTELELKPTATVVDIGGDFVGILWMTPLDILRCTIEMLNAYRESYLETKDKQDWWQMIQLLPSSYNQRRTVMLNYEVLANMYKSRRNHKLDEWHTFCDWIESLPYSELITGKGNSAPENSYCSGRR